MKNFIVLSFLLAAVGTTFFAYSFADRFDDPTFLPPDDFLEYWAAGRATLEGKNPYDGDVIMQIQTSAKRIKHHPAMMWNPPWSLPITFTVCWMPWRTGQVVWLIANLLCLMSCSIALWRLYGGIHGQYAIPLLTSVLFFPTFFLIMSGQISGFLLLGLVGFLVCVQTDHWALAGIFAALTSVKPHLFVPFAAILALEAIRGTSIRRSVLAGAGTLTFGSFVVMLWNPHIWCDYFAAVLTPSADQNLTLHDWIHPTLGCAIRRAWPGHPFRVMFLPLLIGLPIVVAIYWQKRASWDWLKEFPVLIVFSFMLAPYGAWAFDMVVLLIPLISIAAIFSRTMRPNYIYYICAAFGATNILGWFALNRVFVMMNA